MGITPQSIGPSTSDLQNSENTICRPTVTKATQNDALLWKIPVLGMEKAPCWCRNLLSLAHTGILHVHSSMPEMSSGLRSRTFCDAGRFCKCL